MSISSLITGPESCRNADCAVTRSVWAGETLHWAQENTSRTLCALSLGSAPRDVFDTALVRPDLGRVPMQGGKRQSSSATHEECIDRTLLQRKIVQRLSARPDWLEIMSTELSRPGTTVRCAVCRTNLETGLLFHPPRPAASASPGQALSRRACGSTGTVFWQRRPVSDSMIPRPSSPRHQISTLGLCFLNSSDPLGLSRHRSLPVRCRHGYVRLVLGVSSPAKRVTVMCVFLAIWQRFVDLSFDLHICKPCQRCAGPGSLQPLVGYKRMMNRWRRVVSAGTFHSRTVQDSEDLPHQRPCRSPQALRSLLHQRRADVKTFSTHHSIEHGCVCIAHNNSNGNSLRVAKRRRAARAINSSPVIPQPGGQCPAKKVCTMMTVG